MYITLLGWQVQYDLLLGLVLGASVIKSKYEMFIQPIVQELLLELTGVDPNITLPDNTKLKRPKEITLMNEDQLKKVC